MTTIKIWNDSVPTKMINSRKVKPINSFRASLINIFFKDRIYTLGRDVDCCMELDRCDVTSGHVSKVNKLNHYITMPRT